MNNASPKSAAVLLASVLALSSAACQKESAEETTGSASSKTAAASKDAAPSQPQAAKKPDAGKKSDAKETATGEQEAAATAQGAKCPAGKWGYDYSDQALEKMMAKMPDAKVKSKSGEFVCEVGEGEAASITCSTVPGQPIDIEVAANASGMAMLIKVHLEGTAITNFKTVSQGTWEVSANDMSKMKMTTSARVGGQKMTLPVEKVDGFFGENGSITHYRCPAADVLELNYPQAGDDEAIWHKLTRVQ